MIHWRDSIILPLAALVILATVLAIIWWRSIFLPEMVVEAKRDDVTVTKVGDRIPLPAPDQTSLEVGQGIYVDENGSAILTFGDGLKTEIFRDSGLELVTLPVDSGSTLIELRHTLGTILSDFSASEYVANRLVIYTEIPEAEIAKVINTEATGTEFIVAREKNAPLYWIVALEADGKDLELTLTDGGVKGSTFPVFTGFARWVAPATDKPSELVFFPQPEIEEWLDGVRNGQPQPEIGDVIWAAASDNIDSQDFQNLVSIRRGEPFTITLQSLQQGATVLTLDPERKSGNPVDVLLEDCNGDSLRDIPIQNETLLIDFRNIRARVRDVELTVFNRTAPSSGMLEMFDPARQKIPFPFESITVGPGEEQVLKAATVDQIYHYAELNMANGCLIAFSFPTPTLPLPPTFTPTPTPSPTLVPPSTPTPSPIPPDTPTPPIVTPTPLPVTPPVAGGACQPPPSWIEYMVQRGDTLNSLAQRTSKSVYELQQANCLDSFTLEIGQKIYLPFTPPTPAVEPDPTTPSLTSQPPTVTRIPTPIRPFISECTPRSGPVGQSVNFFCLGENFRPNESGFLAELVGPRGVSLDIQFGTSTSLQAIIPPTLPIGQYDLVVVNPDRRAGAKSSAYEVVGQTGRVMFSAASYKWFEGTDATGPIIEVTLSEPSDQKVRVNYATSDGTATAGEDYMATSGTLIFAPGKTTETFVVRMLDDQIDEANETVKLTLGNPVNAALGTPAGATLTIIDNDSTVQFNGASYEWVEDAGTEFEPGPLIEVILSEPNEQEVRVNYATSDGTATSVDDFEDYVPTSGTLIFEPSVTRRTFRVPILSDRRPEGDETVNLTLSNAVNAELGTPANAIIIILDDDPTVGQNLYGIDVLSGNGMLWSVDKTTGAGQAIGPTKIGQALGLACSLTAGKLYGVSSPLQANSTLFEVDSQTGQTSFIGDTGFDAVRGLALDSQSGVLYAITYLDELLTIDPATGEAALAGRPASEFLDSLAYHAQQQALFAVNINTSTLYRINPNTGTGQPVGPTGFVNISGLTYDATTDTLYGAARADGQLVTLDVNTGKGTPVGSMPNTAFNGLAACTGN